MGWLESKLVIEQTSSGEDVQLTDIAWKSSHVKELLQ